MTPAGVAVNLMPQSVEEEVGTCLERLIEALQMAKLEAKKKAEEEAMKVEEEEAKKKVDEEESMKKKAEEEVKEINGELAEEEKENNKSGSHLIIHQTDVKGTDGNCNLALFLDVNGHLCSQ